MMFMHIRRVLVYFSENNSSSICKFRVCHSRFPLQFFSTSTEKRDVPTSPVAELLHHKYQFSPEVASQVASALRGRKSLENYDLILSFLKESGFSSIQLEKIFKSIPTLLSAKPETNIMPKINSFKDLGFSAEDTVEIITNDPYIMRCSLNNRVIPSLSLLKEVLGSNVEVAKILKISGYFVTYNAEKTLVPNVKFLKSCGIAVDQIIWLMFNSPKTLLCKPETMEKYVDKIDAAGIRRSSKMFIHAIRVLSSMKDEIWEQKMKAFRNIGFSEDDIVATFRKAPQVFTVSEEKMNKLKEVLLASGKYDSLCIVHYPKSLIHSIEKTYKPRLHVLKVLESKNLIKHKHWPTFSSLYRMRHDIFAKKYIAPYLGVFGYD